MALDPKLRQAIAGHLQYLRDLGISDFYRRGEPLPVEPSADAHPVAMQPADEPAIVTATVTNTQGTAVLVAEPAVLPNVPRIQPHMPQPSPLTSFTSSSAPIAPELRAEALQAIRDEIGDCQRCPLAPTRNKLVFGDGDPNARLMFVGEGPGADEDAQGLPFVGRGGQLLNNMISAMGLTRAEVYIANIVKCRPPKNRTPEPIEANTCKPFLFQQIEAVRPDVIVALGSTAATYLLGVKSPLSALRGRIHHALGTRLVVTYHPAFLLRDPTQKKEAWKDLQIAMAELGLKAMRAGS